MNKKNAWSTRLLSIIVTVSILFSVSGNVWADPVDPGDQDPAVTSEQEEPETPAEPTDPATPDDSEDPADPAAPEDPAAPPETTPPSNRKGGAEPEDPPAETYDISTLPEAGFSVAQQAQQIDTYNHSGYSDIKCEFSPLTFGKLTVGEQVLAAPYLNLTFDRTGTLSRKDNGEEVFTFEVNNAAHSLNSTDKLSFDYSWNENDRYDPFTISFNIKNSDYRNLTPGKYEGKIRYESTWKAFDPNTNPNDYQYIKNEDQYIYFYITITDYVIETGRFGNKLKWSVSTDGTLTISGNGAMPDFTRPSDAPWMTCKDEIKALTIESGITSIGNYSFSGLTNLATVNNLPEGITSIGQRAFANCPFVLISIPQSLTSIGEGAFFNCSNLATIYMFDNVTSIGEFAFGKCTNINNIRLSDNLTAISRSAFSECSSLTGIKIPDSVTSIGNSAFTQCYSLSSVAGMTNVAEIGAGAFSQCEELTEIRLPAKLTKISTRTFEGCSMLRKVFIPNGVKSIEEDAFRNCGRLSSISFPQSVTSISADAFCGCSRLRSIYCHADPDKLTWGASDNDFDPNHYSYCYVAEEYLDKYRSKFSSINVQFRTGNYAQGGCGVGMSWVLGFDGTLTINGSGEGKMADYSSAYCPWTEYIDYIEAVVIGDGVKEIGACDFKNHTSLSSVTISGDLEVIGESAFEGCTGLSSITIPGNVKTISAKAFKDCELDSLTISDGVTLIDDQAFNNNNITTLVIPGSVETIESNAFCKCKNLETVIILDGVETINDNAFSVCDNLRSVTIPSSVTTLAGHAFGDGQKITDIYCSMAPGNFIGFSWGVGYNRDTTMFHFPAELLDQYRQMCPNLPVENTVGDAEGSGQINTGAGVHLYGYTLSLAGDIGVNFWMKLSDECSADNNYMLFTVNGRTQKVKVSEATAASNSEYLVFTCGVAAKEMTDTISAQFYRADGTAVGSAYSYTVREYANYILTHDDYSQKAKVVVKTMLNYGACSQKYFNYHTDSLANSVLPEGERYPSIASPNGIICDGEGSGDITPQRVSLSLNSTVTLKLYFNNADAEGKVFKLDGKVLKTVKSGGYTVVFIDNISALNLTSLITFDICENENVVGHVSYCPAKYCKIVLGMTNGGAVTDELKLVVSSLYYFNSALKNYV